MRRFDATPRRATPKGHKTFISHAAAQSVKVSYLHRGLSLLRTWRTDNPRLRLVEGQSSRRQPCGQPRLDLLGLLPGMAADDQVVGISSERRAAAFHFS